MTDTNNGIKTGGPKTDITRERLLSNLPTEKTGQMPTSEKKVEVINEAEFSEIADPSSEGWSKKKIALTVGLAALIIIGALAVAGASAAGNVHLDHSKINLDWFSAQDVEHIPNYAWVDLGGVAGVAGGIAGLAVLHKKEKPKVKVSEPTFNEERTKEMEKKGAPAAMREAAQNLKTKGTVHNNPNS